ncbi:hypothetical protein LCGC14_0465700 [marine sediment metagenome]|uniref:Uncharacterized protein n=1 Tax=marine sediment metagenome TaxID=412755 RepID=A0A0F9V0H8_9ZZZZ
MPTEKIYLKVIQASKELIDLGLNGWQTELTITNKKKKIKTDVKIIFELKKKSYVEGKKGEGK